MNKAPYLLVFHFYELLSLHVWSGQRQDGDGTLHPVVLCQFTAETMWEKRLSEIFASISSQDV